MHIAQWLRIQISRWTPSSGFFRAPVNPHKNLGLAGELAAARFLKKLGYRVIERGHRQRRGEIDLIAIDRDCIVFVEVKSRSSVSDRDPAEAVDLKKQRFLTRAALIYLKKHNLLDHASRFDVISITWPKEAPEPTIRHFKDAFEATGTGQLYS